MNKKFNKDIKKFWNQSKKESTECVFDALCEKIDMKYKDEQHNVYVRILWRHENPFDVYEELLELGIRFNIKQAYIDYDNDLECTVIAALHENRLKR